jgi:NhaP-type Na+/H+ or K+/H+ antiporter
LHSQLISTLVVQLVSVLALAVSRALNVWPNAALVNYGRPPDLRIPQAQQFMMWFSGMRGAMAFAMVLRALEDLPGECYYAISIITDVAPSFPAISWSIALHRVLPKSSSGTHGIGNLQKRWRMCCWW